MTYSDTSAGISDLRNAIDKLHNICRNIEDGYDPLMAVDEITKILFIKLSEERTAQNGGENRFSKETMEAVCSGSAVSESEWLNGLLEDNVEKSAGTFPYGEEDEIELSDESVSRMVEILSNFELLEEEADVKGVAYEELLNKVFRDTLGQYFTPREVVKFMVKLVNPEVHPESDHVDKVIDPGVGSGGFLIATLEHYLDECSDEDIRRELPEALCGIDRSPRMSKVATTNLMLHGEEDWKPFSRIYQGNSLNTNSDGIPVTSHDDENGEVPFGEFDKLLANPPFGSEARDELAEKVTNHNEYSSHNDILEVHKETEALFLKRSIELLRPGGELAIVLPKNVIKGSGFDDLQEWLLKNAVIKSVIHLPLSTFRPFGSDVKTVVLHVQKRDDNLSQGDIYFDAARYVGYDATGKSIPENDLGAIAENYHAARNGGLNSEIGDEKSKSFGVLASAGDFEEKVDDGGLDPLYYILDNSDINDQISQGLNEGADEGHYELRTLKDVATRRTDKINRTTDADSAFIIFANDVDRPLGKVTSLSLETKGEDGELGSYVVCKPGDVIYYRMRPYLRKAAVVPDSITLESGEEIDLSEAHVACSPEFCVLSVDSEDREKISGYGSVDLKPEFLWLVLRSNMTLFQVLPTIKGGTRPRVPFNAVMNLEIPIPDESTQARAIEEYGDMQNRIKKYRERRQNVIDSFKEQHGEDLFSQLGMNEMRSLDDDVISLLVEADILPKSYHTEFY